MKNIYYTIQSTVLAGMILPYSAYAQLTKPTNSHGLVQNSNFADVIEGVVYWVLTILASLSILVIVISGVMYITSAGDQGRVDTAKSMLTYAIVGLIISLLGYVIVYSVGRALGAN